MTAALGHRMSTPNGTSKGPRCPSTSAPYHLPHSVHDTLPSQPHTKSHGVIPDSHMQPIRNRPAPSPPPPDTARTPPPRQPAVQPLSGLFHNLLLGALIPAPLLQAPPCSQRDPFNSTQQRLLPTQNPTAAPFSLTAKANGLPTATVSHAIRPVPTTLLSPRPTQRVTASTLSRHVVVTTPVG